MNETKFSRLCLLCGVQNYFSSDLFSQFMSYSLVVGIFPALLTWSFFVGILQPSSYITVNVTYSIINSTYIVCSFSIKYDHVPMIFFSVFFASFSSILLLYLRHGRYRWTDLSVSSTYLDLYYCSSSIIWRMIYKNLNLSLSGKRLWDTIIFYRRQ